MFLAMSATCLAQKGSNYADIMTAGNAAFSRGQAAATDVATKSEELRVRIAVLSFFLRGNLTAYQRALAEAYIAEATELRLVLEAASSVYRQRFNDGACDFFMFMAKAEAGEPYFGWLGLQGTAKMDFAASGNERIALLLLAERSKLDVLISQILSP